VLAFSPLSVDACTSRGKPKAQCEESLKSVLSLANGRGTRVSYGSQDSCVEVHGPNNCPKVTKDITTLIYNGNSNSLLTVTTKSYLPPIIGWLAAVRDLKMAVPLYPTDDSKIAIRYDGKKFALGN
jgi:uncharacterized protein YgiB involved in biofilm formation